MISKTITASILAVLVSSSIAFANDTIDNKREFIEKVVGKKVAQGSSTWLLPRSDGKLDGRVKGIKVTGDWYWQGSFWCRTARIGILPVPRECQKITLLGDNKLELHRHKGTGSRHIYTVY